MSRAAREAALLAKIDDLLIQATRERSHYYTAAVLTEARQVLSALVAEREAAKRLRDASEHLLQQIEEGQTNSARHGLRRAIAAYDATQADEKENMARILAWIFSEEP